MKIFITSSLLFSFCRDLLEAAGSRPQDAEVVSRVIIDTSLEGVDTHGISRLPVYLSCLASGRIAARPDIRLDCPAPSLARVDGGNGLGQLVGVKAMEAAIDLARDTGAGFAVVKRSNHFGAASYYCKMAARENMIGMAMTNTPAGIPPWGGRQPFFGTNPIAFAFPSDPYPVVIDMSASVVARGNVIQAAREGRPIPGSWAMDSEGRPTTDPGQALKGSLLPMSGPKGYALALAVEVMAGILSGSACGPGVGWIYDDSTSPPDVGHSFMAINIESLMPLEVFAERLSVMIGMVKAVPRTSESEGILIPGERRHLTSRERYLNGIPLTRALLDELNAKACLLGTATLDI